jgi:sec-independent protein translocase protein TatA
MGGFSWIHVLIFAVIAVLLFGGRGKISDLMGDVAKGIRSFKQGLSEPDEAPKTLTSERRDEPASLNKDQTVNR